MRQSLDTAHSLGRTHQEGLTDVIVLWSVGISRRQKAQDANTELTAVLVQDVPGRGVQAVIVSNILKYHHSVSSQVGQSVPTANCLVLQSQTQ